MKLEGAGNVIGIARCRDCRKLKHLSAFRLKNSKGRRDTRCGDCQSVYQIDWEKNNRAKRNANVARWVSARKLEVIQAYGGGCKCCGEAAPEFLAIDHMLGGGIAHRREISGGSATRIYGWLKKQGWPQDEFQLLCHNCNQSFGMYGACPHNPTVTRAVVRGFPRKYERAG